MIFVKNYKKTMKRKIKFLNVLILLMTVSILSFSQKESDIIGNWSCYRVEDEEGTTGESSSLFSKPYNTDYALSFPDEDNTIYTIKGTKQKAKYKIIDGKKLIIDKMPFEIVKLTDKLLVLREICVNENSLVKFNFTYYYKRVE